MSISASSGRNIVDFKAQGISGAKMAGAYLLRLSVGCNIQTGGEEALSFSNVTGNVYLSDTLLLGKAFPEVPLTILSGRGPITKSILFEVMLSGLQIEAIEKVRDGGNLRLTLKIIGEYTDAHNRLPGTDDLHFHVSQSEWLSTLSQMGYGNYLLLELPIDLQDSGSMDVSRQAFHKAKQHLREGNYDEVVAKCRLALEELMKAIVVLSDARRLYKENRQAMSKEQRIANIVDAVNHSTQLAHHLDSAGRITPYSRADAIFILGSTASALSCYSDKEI
jgi:HEPN domain-containing protein